MRAWTEKQRQEIDVFVRDNNLFGNEEEIEEWIKRLMEEEEVPFSRALARAAVLFGD